MTEESSGLLLNLSTIHIKKKKKKSESTSENFLSKPDAIITPKINPATIGIYSKPKKISTSQPKLVQVIQSKLTSSPLKSVSEPQNTLSGILKKDKNISFHSIWKKFKESNKSHGVKTFISSKPISETLLGNQKKKLQKANCLKQRSKKVSFNESNSFSIKDNDEELKSASSNPSASDNYSFEADFVSSLSTKKIKTGFEKANGNFKEKTLECIEPRREWNKGKITSLFHNNPEIPEIPHRAVKPLKEDVFSNVSFESLGLHSYMVKYLRESMGLITTTTVQAKAIPVLLGDKDALIRSQTGSGKTLAFALPLLHKLQEIRPKINRADGVMALIVLPTRELALQTYEVFNKLVKSYTWIVPGYLVGGEKRKSEKARLRKGITILIGTPGRLIDHINHTKALKLDKVQWFVIDEADRLLDLGYEKDVSVLLDTLNANTNSSLLHPTYMYPTEDSPNEEQTKSRQTILLSATLTPKVQKLAGLSLRDPAFVDACEDRLHLENRVPVLSTDIGTETDAMILPESLTQKYVVVPPKLKLVTLAALILQISKIEQRRKMLAFLGTQDMVDYYGELLSLVFKTSSEDGDGDELSGDAPRFSASGVEMFKLHGNMKQSERTEVFKTFRMCSMGVLLCTDVAARGLDLPEVDWVIQFTGPISVSDYVHRVGRTARGGQSGSSIIFLTPNEVRFIGRLENCQIRLRETKMEDCLVHLTLRTGKRTRLEEEATKLQTAFEKAVANNGKLYDSACKAYASWSRFYASYPKNMRDAFSVKAVHQGHHAKSFALRDPPSAIVSHARNKNLNEKRFPKKRPRERDESEKKAKKFEGKGRLSNISEFDSGLEPLPKKKKKTKKEV